MDPNALTNELQHTYALFAPIWVRFVGVGIERGGVERVGVVQVYVKRYGEYLSQVFSDIQHFRVESTFTPEQLTFVNATLLMLKKTASIHLHQQIIEEYRNTKPYFLLAVVNAIESVLDLAIRTEPHQAATLDAIFRVAGSEGLRDVIRLYAAHTLEHVLNQTKPTIPDLLAFVNVHIRETPSGTIHGEVWCPGTDLTKVLLQSIQTAATELVQQHNIPLTLPLDSEITQLPLDLVHHFTEFVQRRAHSVFLRLDDRGVDDRR